MNFCLLYEMWEAIALWWALQENSWSRSLVGMKRAAVEGSRHPENRGMKDS